jgi:acyl-coenzyme A synthetase/AMP-(fatty) acid ligase
VPVDPAQPPSLADLRTYVKRTQPAFQAPRRVVTCGEIPRTTLGKIRRADLDRLDH